MAKTLRNTHFTRPIQQGLFMLMLLIAFGLIIIALLPQLEPIFLASPYLISFILIVFAVGVIACFLQIIQLSKSVRWINAYSQGNPNKMRGTPRLLAPLAVMMRGNQLPSGMSTASAQSILDSVAIRLDESRDITRYIINLLIFLGLLGTFYGLAVTIPAVVETISSLTASSEGDTATMFSDLMNGLEKQLGGMGTAFGSSLIGLGGSLMVGLLELLAGHGQNRFYREFEEWLSRFTSVGMAETGNGLELSIDPKDDTPLAKAFRGLNDALLKLDKCLETQGDGIKRVGDLFESINENMKDAQSMSADMRNAMRAVETQILRMNEDTAMGRDGATREMRRDLLAINQSLREIIDMQGE